MLYENIADHDHNFFGASAASDSSVTSSSVTSSSERSDDDNPEPASDRVRRSRGGGSTLYED